MFRVRRFLGARWSSLIESISAASNAEKVRAILALTLVGLLIALQFAPSDFEKLTVATETLAISVVAFYFGLHSGPTIRGREGGSPGPRGQEPTDKALQ